MQRSAIRGRSTGHHMRQYAGAKSPRQPQARSSALIIDSAVARSRAGSW